MSNSPKTRREWTPDATLSGAPVACHEIDLEGKLVWVNAAECRLLGFDEADLVGREVWELVALEDREVSREAVARKLRVGCQPGRFERTLMRSDGTRLVLEMHEDYVRDRTGAIIGMRTFLIDITERKRAEDALRKIQENLEQRVRERTQELELAIEFLRREMEDRRQAEEEHRKLEAHVQMSQRLESMGVLAGGVAHEFNNLLTSIMGYASLAAMDLPDDGPARKNIGYVLEAAQSAAGLTQQMLAYSGRGKFVVELLDVSKLVEGMKRLLESMVSGKASLEIRLASDLPPIEADAGQVRQVVMSLFSNAADAIDKPGGAIAISTGVMWAEGGELPPLQTGRILCAGLYVYVEVSDSGSGMDSETAAKIFEPFFTTKFTGRGLGLAAVQGIMRGHRGSVQVTSRVGEGSVFRALFPAKDEWQEPEQ
jgi:two-component system, cell cycle sensor histidine kinase and response regulator CckA